MSNCIVDRTPGATCDPAGRRAVNCCEGTEVSVPRAHDNRPGLPLLAYRVGTQGTFFESLLARLAAFGVNRGKPLPDPVTDTSILERRIRRTTGSGLPEYDASTWVGKAPLLRDLLTTRETSDPAIAIFDMWSTLADVLTFYQERIANEGFLRTASEPRSLTELSRLVGYRPRPGVSSSVYLAFEVDDATPQSTLGFGNNVGKTNGDVTIPKGTAAKSTPNPGSDEKPQTFETSRDLIARKEWNALHPRASTPHDLRASALADLETLFFAGVGLRLRPNDLLAIEYDPAERVDLRNVLAVVEDNPTNTTRVTVNADSLSPKKLKSRLKPPLVDFLNALPAVAPFVTATFYKELLDAAQRAIIPFQKGSLVEIDTNVGGMVDNLEESGGLGRRLTALRELANRFESHISPVAPERGVFDPRAVAATFKSGHVDLVNRYVAHLNAVDTLLNVLAPLPPTPLRDILAKVKSTICAPAMLQIESTTADRPKVFVALDESGLIAPTSNSVPVPAELVFDDGSALATAEYASVVALGDTPAGIVPPPAIANKSLADLQTDLRTRTMTLPDNTLCVLQLKITNAAGHLASALRLLRRNKTLGDFAGIEIEKTCYCRASESNVAIDRDFAIPNAPTPGTAKPYWAKISISWPTQLTLSLTDANYHSTPDASIANTWRLEAAADQPLIALRDAVRGLILVTPGSGRAAMLIEFFDAPSATTPPAVAAVLRDLVFYTTPFTRANPSATSLHERLATVHGALCTDRDSLATPTLIAGLTSDFNQPVLVSSKTILQNTLIDMGSAEELSDALRKSDAPITQLVLDGVTSVGRHNKDFLADLNALQVDTSSQLAKMLSPATDMNSGLYTIEHAVASSENGIHLDSTYLSDWRLNTLAPKVAVAKATIATLIPIEAAVTAEHFRDHTTSDVSIESNHFADLLGAQALTSTLRPELDALRTTFNRRLAAEVESHSRAIPFPDTIKTILTLGSSSQLSTLDSKDWTLEQQICSFLKNPLSGPCVPDQSELFKLKVAVDDQSDNRIRSAGTAIVKGWERLVKLVTSPPSDSQDQPHIISDIANAVSDSLERVGRESTGASSAFVTLVQLLTGHPDLIPQIAGRLLPDQRELLYDTLRQLRGGAGQPVPKVWAFRSEARLFGWNAPENPLVGVDADKAANEIPANLDKLKKYIDDSRQKPIVGATEDTENDDRLFLDAIYKQTVPGSPIVVSLLGQPPQPYHIEKVSSHPRSLYNLSADCTTVTLEVGETWWTPASDPFDTLRTTRVFCDAEVLPLAEAPEPEFVGDEITPPTSVVLDELTFGLSAGAPLIVEGAPEVNGTGGSALTRELVTLVDVDQMIELGLYGDRFRTQLTFDRPLQHAYLRASMKVYANVVEATHGETVREVLGNGDATKAFPRFGLKRPELTRLPAPTPRGVENILEVRVNDVAWKETDAFIGLQDRSEAFVSFTDAQRQSVVVFGDGLTGARISTGTENVCAVYRAGLGAKGNVDAGQIDQAIGAPLGVKKVINPLPAQGGTDPEGEDTLRWHVPLAVTGMDRLVSVQDFADFASAYAGIGKASATRSQGIVHVTVASPSPRPFDMKGPIIRNLRRALRLFGDPSQRFALHDCEVSLLIISAKVRIERDYVWEKVEPQIRQSLLAQFRYETMELGQDLLSSAAILAIQEVEGVVYVDVDVFDSVRQDQVSDLGNRLRSLQLRPRIHVDLARYVLDDSGAPSGGNGIGAMLAGCSLRQASATQQAPVASTTPPVPSTSRTNPAPIAPATGAKDNSGADTASNRSTRDPSIPVFRSAQICFLPTDIRDTLVLEQLK